MEEKDKNMLVIELNEFNRDLIDSVARRLGLRHLRTILDWQYTRTWTEDQYDSGFLEPWAQWVSVHTGVPTSDHSVKNLGDVPLEVPSHVAVRGLRLGLPKVSDLQGRATQPSVVTDCRSDRT